MNPLWLIEKYYVKNSTAYKNLVTHSRLVANLALEIAKKHPELDVDLAFIDEAAMLHDIGIIYTHAPKIGCHGDYPYICHGYLGRDILEQAGMPMHARVSERHTGIGLTIKDIESQKLPLPLRDMIPETTEEQIICFADKFYSKGNLTQRLTPEVIREKMLKYGESKIHQFDLWMERFHF